MAQNDCTRPGVRPSSEESSVKLQAIRARAAESLAAQRERFEQLESELTRRITQLAESFDANYASSAGLATRDKELATAYEQIAMLQTQLDEEAERNAQIEAAENRRLVELEQFQDQLAAAREALETIRSQSCEEGEQLASALESVTHERDVAAAEATKLQQENAALHQELALARSTAETSSEQLASMSAKRDELAARLEASEKELADKSRDEVVQQDQLLELARQLHQATDENDALRSEIEQLRQAKLEQQSSPASSTVPAGTLNWEAQKLQLLAMLDDEVDGGSEISAQRKQERATIADTMTITDRVLAEKDARIVELQAALEVQPKTAASDAAVAHREALLNSDDVVIQERQRLQELNAQWQSKMRSAELEMSLERAKLARERAALNEQLAAVKASPPEGADKTKNRWRNALGLRDE